MTRAKNHSGASRRSLHLIVYAFSGVAFLGCAGILVYLLLQKTIYYAPSFARATGQNAIQYLTGRTLSREMISKIRSISFAEGYCNLMADHLFQLGKLRNEAESVEGRFYEGLHWDGKAVKKGEWGGVLRLGLLKEIERRRAAVIKQLASMRRLSERWAREERVPAPFLESHRLFFAALKLRSENEERGLEAFRKVVDEFLMSGVPARGVFPAEKLFEALHGPERENPSDPLFEKWLHQFNRELEIVLGLTSNPS